VIGAFSPGRLPVDLESVYVRADAAPDHGWLGGIVASGRQMMVTIEPFEWPSDADLRRWAEAFRRFDNVVPILVRYCHEMNLDPERTPYPWGGDPVRFYREWARFVEAMPENVETVWSPNVGYPGSRPMTEYWPRATGADWLGLDGYAWDDESFADVFRASLATLRTIAPDLPVMIAETAHPRGAGQTAYARDAARAVERGDVQAVVWFQMDKERRWKLSDSAARAFVSGPRS